MKRNIQPRGKMVLIDPEREVKISEIIELPDSSSAKPKCKGTVLAIGPNVSRYIKEGDVVFYEHFDWTPAPDDAIIISEDEVIAREVRE